MEFKAELIAPCGMDCNVCKGYLAYSRWIPRQRGVFNHCAGCRPREKSCGFLKQRCNKLLNKEVQFCYECERFPCSRLETIDRRYRTNYNASLIGNLRQLQEIGIPTFLRKEAARYRCPECDGVVCIHDGVCYDCYVKESSKLKVQNSKPKLKS